MFEDILLHPVASLCLDGKKYELTPASMRRSGDSYSRTIGDDLTVILDFQKPTEAFYRWTVRLRNDGPKRTAQITRILGADISWPVASPVSWESLHGDICGADSFMPLKETIGEGAVITHEATEGRSSQGEHFPYFDLTGEGWSAVVGIGWTGQWRYTLSLSQGVMRFQAGFTDCDFYLEPGEEARSVGILLCASNDSVLAARQRFRRGFMTRLSPAARAWGFEAPCTVQVFDRYFRKRPDWATEEGQLKCIERSAAIGGFNAYWLDAAWFRDGFPTGVGNYTFEAGFPKGLLPVSHAAHKAGMRFVVWFEPERVDKDSDTAREHPDFLLSSGIEDDRNRLFDLTNDRAYAWLKDTLVRFIRENGIDVYRQDFNMDPLVYWRSHDGINRRGYTENRYITRLYQLWDELLLEFPGLMIDNCSSGGRRLDWEMLSRSIPLWRSDTGCSPESESQPKSVWNQNQTLELTRYLPFHCDAVWTTDAWAFRSVATMGIACNFDVLNDAFDTGEARPPIREFNELKPYWTGDFYPLTEASLSDGVWAAFQLNGPAGGACYFFRRKNAPRVARFALNGIIQDRMYHVKLRYEDYSIDEKAMVGSQLQSLDVTIDEGNQSLVLEYAGM